MKRILSLFIILSLLISVFSVFAVNASAESEPSDTDFSSEALQRKEYTWAYVLIAVLATGGIISAAVLISKKKE